MSRVREAFGEFGRTPRARGLLRHDASDPDPDWCALARGGTRSAVGAMRATHGDHTIEGHEQPLKQLLFGATQRNRRPHAIEVREDLIAIEVLTETFEN